MSEGGRGGGRRGEKRRRKRRSKRWIGAEIRGLNIWARFTKPRYIFGGSFGNSHDGDIF